MGLLQKAVETYDAHTALVGEVQEGHEVLAPVGHTTKSAAYEITINQDGVFCSARIVTKGEPKIIVPATEDAEGRSGKKADQYPYPLSDKLKYYVQQPELFLAQLAAWEQSAFSHPKLNPVLTYIRAGTIVADLAHSGCLPKAKDGIPSKDELDGLVSWNVIGLGDTSGPCYTDLSLMQAFTNYYLSLLRDKPHGVCMIDGSNSALASKHPKGIIPFNGNAKLISANDSSNFTYRGRFSDDAQAATVGYIASQKAHNALRWLAAEQGARVVFGGRTFLCWNPQGIQVCHAVSPLRPASAETKPSDYKAALQKTLDGCRSELPEQNAGVVIAAFDAATTGRLSLTYYNELLGSDFLQRLYDWDETFCWWARDYETNGYRILSPSLYQIVKCAFGTQRVENNSARLVPDDRVLRQQMQRLVSCRVDRARFPADIVQALIERASTPLAYAPGVRERLLTAACAAIRKYHHDYFEEELQMELDKSRADRSYQYGRLLAVLEKVERDTYDKDESRDPNAIRLQTMFRRRPLHTFGIVNDQLERAYFPRLKPVSRSYYKRLISEIVEIIYACPESEWDKPLEDTYLMGYYLQRKDLYTAKTEKTGNTDEEEN